MRGRSQGCRTGRRRGLAALVGGDQRGERLGRTAVGHRGHRSRAGRRPPHRRRPTSPRGSSGSPGRPPVAGSPITTCCWSAGCPEMTAMRALTPAEAERARRVVRRSRCRWPTRSSCRGAAPTCCPNWPPRWSAPPTCRRWPQYSGTTFGLIGYDLVPITTAETSHEGMAPGFARNLAAGRYARVIAPISHGAAGEYLGWRDMLAGTGLSGPRIEPVVLPSHAPRDDPDADRPGGRTVDRRRSPRWCWWSARTSPGRITSRCCTPRSGSGGRVVIFTPDLHRRKLLEQ